MTPDLYFAYPGDLGALTGGYGYDRRVIAELAQAGLTVETVALGNARPGGSEAEFVQAAETLGRLAAGVPAIVDGLALGVLPEGAAAARARGPLVALVHHPLALETGLEPAAAERLRTSERAALRHADAVIVTSPATRRTIVAEYGVAEERVHTAPPGVDRKPFASPSAEPPVRLLSVGSLIPRKGYDILLDALATLADLDWTATIVGGGDARTAEALRARAAAAGIAECITFAGALPYEELDAHYRAADVFVLPSLYEGYGMVIGEALAFGLPVVGTDGGALADTIPDGAGRKARAGDAADLARHLRAVVGEPEAIAAMAECARAVAERLPRWPQTAAVFRHVLDDLG